MSFLIRVRSKGVTQDLSIPNHERIGAEGKPGFCLPKKKGDFTHDLLALDLDRLMESFRQAVDQGGEKRPDLGESSIGGVVRNEHRIVCEVIHDRIDSFLESLKVVLEYGLSGG
jgi:hypothetical protein